MADTQTITLPVKWMRDKLGNKFFPRTHINAVKDDSGRALSTILNSMRKVQVTEEQMEQMIANRSWEAGVTYYTVEDE